MIPRCVSIGCFALTLYVAAVCAGPTSAEGKKGVVVESDAEITACRLGNPEDCSVSRGEAGQALFRERCKKEPGQCEFRADGTIERWRGKAEWPPALESELRRLAEIERERLRAQEKK